MSSKSRLHGLKRCLADIFLVWRHELGSFLHDEGVMIFCLIVPLAYPLLYGFIYTEEVVREVPVVVVDEDKTALSREFTRLVDATADVSIVARCADMEEAREALRRHEANGILRLPSDFSLNANNINRWQQAHVEVYCDMSSMFYYKALYSAATSVSLDMNRQIKVRRNSALTTARDEEINTSPVSYEYVPMFNPTGGYDGFLLPAVLILILQQTLVLGIGMRNATVMEHYRNGLPSIADHRIGTLSMLLGQALLYFMIYSLCALWTLVCIPHIFNLPQMAHPWSLFRFVLVFIADITFFAMTVSVIVRGREKPMLLFAFLSVPLLFLSGISWPGSALPWFWKAFSWIFPSTFGINGFVRLNTLSADLSQVAPEFAGILVQTVLFFLTAYVVYRRMRRS